MSTITKKQASIALIVVALAAVMIAGTIASSADNSVFAKKHKKNEHKKGSTNQRDGTNQEIDLSNKQSQHSMCVSAGAGSPISGSCNNTAASSQTNNGGNAAASSGSGGSGSSQKIGLSNKQSQHSMCVSAGAGSPISGSCNNTAASSQTNNGGNAAASDGSGGSGSSQKIGLHNSQKQHALCVSAGAGSPVTASCNNSATSTQANNAGNALASM